MMHRSFFSLVAGIVVCCLAGCQDKKPAATVPVPEVNYILAHSGDVPVFTEFVGETYGEKDIEIQARVDGWVTGIHFKEGDFVKKGQLLYMIDDQPIRTRIDAAAAQVAQANTQLVKAKADLDRVRPLTEMNALAKRELDAAIASYDAARAQVMIAKAGLDNAKIELSYTRIQAPISGIIGISRVQQGDFVGKGVGLSNSALNTISATGGMRVRFNVTEAQFLQYLKRKNNPDSVRQLEQAFPVRLLLSDGSIFPETGKIDLTNRQIDPQTGSIVAQALFTNQGGLLRPGQFVKVRLQTSIVHDAVLVPQQAVHQLQNIYQVFVVNDSNQIQPKVVTTGLRTGSNWVINSGLQVGQKVAVIGSAIVKPGMVVKPVQMNWNYDSTSVSN
jgi:membrane fusion protein (multidrug efflux system)